MKRPVQYFTKEYLEQTRKFTPTQAAEFVSDYQKMVFSNEGKRKLISLRVPENLLKHFRTKTQSMGKPYQTQIIDLIREWTLSNQK